MDAYTQPKRALSGGFDTAVVVGAAATGVVLLVAAKQTTPSSNPKQHYIHVQRLKVVVQTGADGVTWQVQDGADSPLVLSPVLDMSVAGTVYTYDFGPQGRKMTLNKNLNVSLSGAGAAADVYIEGFQERTATRIVTFVSVSPAAGPVAGGTPIRIFGTNFGRGATVTVGGVAATKVTVYSDEQSIDCVTPAGSAGTADIVVTNTDTSSVTGAGAFTYA